MYLEVRSVLLGFFFSIAVVANQVTSTCNLSSLFIDIHYRAVDGRSDALSYGLFIGAGGNSQNQSLWPSITNNETRLASNDFCGQQSPEQCHDSHFTHGHFGADSSSSWKPESQYNSLDTASLNPDVNITYGQESLNLFTHYFDPSPATKHVLTNFPITLMSDYQSQEDVFFHSGSLGLGTSSTTLKHMVDQGVISRPVVGFYLGTGYPRAGGSQNGSVVFGGYDAGRIDSTAHVYQMVAPPAPGLSPFKVHVKQFSLVTSDGSSIGLVTDDGFDGYLSTNQYEMELPSTISKRLAAALGATPAGNAENTMVSSNRFSGNITITLDDGYQITYPAEWITNASNLTPFSASTMSSNSTATNETNDQNNFVFGSAFLHHLYMTIDYDASTFSLADAKMYNNYVQTQSLCPGAVPAAMPPPQINKFTQTGLIGAILGGVIGGVGFLWFAFFAVRKTLQHRQSKKAISRLEDGNDDGPKLPKKSSLRTRTKRTFVRFSSNKQMKEITPRHVKRVSFTDSDSSSDKGAVIVVTEKQMKETKEGIEMSNIGHKSQARTNSSPVASTITIAEPLYESPKAGGQVIQQTAIMQSLPTPNRFADPYAPSPGPTPMTADTPRTGNPLLGGFRNNFQEFADDDDSDLPQSQRHHQRSGSEQLRKDLGLRLDTSGKPRTSDLRNPVDITRTSKHKPAPLPLRIGSAPKTAKTEADFIKKNPVRALFGLGGDQRSGTRPSGLSRMFPPPQ